MRYNRVYTRYEKIKNNVSINWKFGALNTFIFFWGGGGEKVIERRRLDRNRETKYVYDRT